MKKSGAKKLGQITVMNALLCIFVVMIHLTFEPLLELTPKSTPHILIFTVNKFLGFCVPTFIFLSGFKLFKSYEKRPLAVKTFLKRRLKKIVFPYFAAVLVYIFYFGVKGWLSESIFSYLILGTISAHFYYIVVLIQLYLLFPLIFRLFKSHSHTVLLVSFFITLFCAAFLQNGYWDRFCGLYIFYFVFGMFWAKYGLYRKFRKNIFKISIAYAAVLIIHLCRLYLSEFAGWTYRTFPVFNIIYTILAIIVLYALSEDFLKYSRRVMTASNLLGECSYSIYLYHLLVIDILKYDILSRYSLSVKWEFFWVTVMVYSVIVAHCAVIHISKKEKNQ